MSSDCFACSLSKNTLENSSPYANTLNNVDIASKLFSVIGVVLNILNNSTNWFFSLLPKRWNVSQAASRVLFGNNCLSLDGSLSLHSPFPHNCLEKFCNSVAMRGIIKIDDISGWCSISFIVRSTGFFLLISLVKEFVSRGDIPLIQN
ncbi:MAG: hypothetical protein LBQ08_04770 [Holosporaceae bacterium]|nr:hypothetical protein [Holosporaceae bacterium]